MIGFSKRGYAKLFVLLLALVMAVESPIAHAQRSTPEVLTIQVTDVEDGDTLLVAEEFQTTLSDSAAKQFIVTPEARVDRLATRSEEKAGIDWGFLISLFALGISAVTLYWEKFRKGSLEVGGVTSVGIQVLFSPTYYFEDGQGPSVQEVLGGTSESDGFPKDTKDIWGRWPEATEEIRVVVPVLFRNTGNGDKEIIDTQIKADFGGGKQILASNKFVDGLGIGSDGSHSFPAASDWKHQIVVGTNESKLKYISFIDRVDSNALDRSVDEITFNLEIKRASNSEFKCARTFRVSMDNLVENRDGVEYTVYPTTETRVYGEHQKRGEENGETQAIPKAR